MTINLLIYKTLAKILITVNKMCLKGKLQVIHVNIQCYFSLNTFQQKNETNNVLHRRNIFGKIYFVCNRKVFNTNKNDLKNEYKIKYSSRK